PRYSYAAHLLQSGTDLRYIQEILGQASSKTTMLCTHIAAKELKTSKAPSMSWGCKQALKVLFDDENGMLSAYIVRV
ncbi:hypothetical protein RZS08_36045, partial [Arthrospira platensis SPKY1]|nr:hypothetical protein [Arthrospira platensis SPKY1]